MKSRRFSISGPRYNIGEEVSNCPLLFISQSGKGSRMKDDQQNDIRSEREISREKELEQEIIQVRADEERLEEKLEQDEKREEELEHALDEEHHRHHNRHVSLIFIINGEDFPLTVEWDTVLQKAVDRVLSESGNTGRRESSEWEVRDSAGVLLDMTRTIKELDLTDGARLFLSLKVGAGGHHAD
jgi:hypothetical protein